MPVSGPKSEESPYREDDASIAAHFDRTAREHKYGFRAVDWGSERSQFLRFDRLTSMLPIDEGCSVLDVGCGIGGFLAYLNGQPIKVDYTGVDVSMEMIRICKEKFPQCTFHCASFLDIDLGMFDFVVASGTFNLRSVAPEAFLRDCVQRMFLTCRRGIGFNCLSAMADRREDGEFHADPTAVLEACHGLTRRVRYDHSYLPHDFTIALLK